MLEEFRNSQSLFYNFIIKSVKNNKISHAYLIETNGVSYAFSLAIAMAKYFLCSDLPEDQASVISKNIDGLNFPDIKYIDSDSVIKKEQILDLQKDFSNKPLYGKYMIYIIKNANNLNPSSTNTLLKFLEEPQDGIVAILLSDNLYGILDTIVSRCQIISLFPEDSDIYDIVYTIIGDVNLSKKLIEDMFLFYYNFELYSVGLIGNFDIYIFKDNIKLLLRFGFYLYYDILNLLLNKPIVYFSKNEKNLIYFVKNNEISDIIRKINVINDFLMNYNYYVNKDLYIDNFIITMSGDE